MAPLEGSNKYKKKQTRIKSMGRTQFSEVNIKLAHVQSPTRKLIAEHQDRLGKFDINKIVRWNPNNIKKFRAFV